MKKLLFLLLFILFYKINFAQFSPEEQKEIDSLVTIINSSNSRDTSIASAYYELSNIFYSSNPDTIIYLCTKAKEIAKKSLAKSSSKKVTLSLKKTLANSLFNIGYIYDNQGDTSKAIGYLRESLRIRIEIEDKSGVAISLNTIGFVYAYKGNYLKALENFQKSLQISEEIRDEIRASSTLNNIGFIYQNQGNIPKAIEYFYKSLKIVEKMGNKNTIVNILNNLGSLYSQQGDIQKAIEYVKKSLKISEEIKNSRSIALCLCNLGSLYNQQGDDQKAIEYAQKSLKISEEIKDKRTSSSSLNILGTISLNNGDYSNAIEYTQKSLKISEEIGDKTGIASSFSSIGSIYKAQKKYSTAITYFQKSKKVSEKIGYNAGIQEVAKNLYEIYENQGNNTKALEMFKLYISIRDSTENEANQKSIIQREFKYQYEKKAAADSISYVKEKEIQQAQILGQASELKSKRNQQYALYGGLLLVLVFAGFMYNRFKVTKKQKNVIEKQKEVVEVAHHELAEKNKEIQDSINYAKRIQEAILPSRYSVSENLKNGFILFKPKDIVSGDFYWLEKVGNTTFIAAADCTGHGVPGAMVSVVCANALSKALLEENITETGRLLDRARELVVERFSTSDEDVKDGMDISLCKLEGNKLQWSGANNPLWIIRKSDMFASTMFAERSRSEHDRSEQNSNNQDVAERSRRHLEEIKPDKQPIGKTDNPTPFTTHNIELHKGDSIYIFTDGYADQFGGEKGKKFKYKTLKDLLLSLQDESLEQQKEQLKQAFLAWKGNLEQVDDVCVIGVRL